jgi:two-component system, cell cycle sensor histidine kinase and response regulator CckA
MVALQKQPQIKSLLPFTINWKPRLMEADLNEIVRTVNDILPEYMHADTITEVELTDENLTVRADIALMRKALINLIQNALDAMPQGGVFVLKTDKVSFNNGSIFGNNGHSFGPCALISLADTGIGIDEYTQKKIFEPFFTTKEGNNKGLGLPVASVIIREHGGIMKLDSVLGEGTVVNVYLPLIWSQMVSTAPIPLPAEWSRCVAMTVTCR